MSGLSGPFELPPHCGPGVPARCGCLWESGTWFPCVTHATPHSMHTTPAPGCDLCDSALDEARETLREPGAEDVYLDCADDAEALGEALRETYDL